jgi:RNA polymerase sigma-70 factor (ECF subfamily)
MRLRAQEPEAWRRLVQLYGPLVYGWCRQAGLRAEDVADVSQEVFQAVAQHIGRFRRDRPGDTFRGWLRTITRNKLCDHWRRCRDHPEAAGGSSAQQRLLQVPEADEGSSPSSSSREEAAAVFRAALELIRAGFAERTWQAFWRVTVEGHAPAEVAAELGMSLGGVYVAKSRVLQRLRAELGDLLEEGEE